MRPAAGSRSIVALAVVAAAFALVACDKNSKTAEPPAELVDLKPSLPVQKVWSNSLGGGGEDLRLSLGVAFQDGVVYAAGRGGKVEAFDAANGRSRWSTDTKLDLSAGPGVGPGLVAVDTNDGDVVALDVQSGKKVWSVKVSSEVLSAPLITTDRVVVRTHRRSIRTIARGVSPHT